MNKEEKIEAGIARAEKDWKTICAWDLWKDVTKFSASYGVSGSWSKQGSIKLYNENAEKYANRPIKMIECGFSTIENDAYLSRLIKHVSDKVTFLKNVK